jgi:hypothetical protein
LSCAVRQSAFAGLFFLTAFLSAPALATISPFLPPAPVEGESRAYRELYEAMSIANDPQRQLRALDLARERTSGPTRLRSYIDCMRVGPLVTDSAMDLALVASDQCVSSFPETPYPRLLRAMVRVHNYEKPDLLVSGTDELISVFSEYPDLHQNIPFSELSSALRGLTAAGESKRKTALVKAYFSPIYIPPPSPTSDDVLLSGIGELLDSGDIALAARLAGFLQKENYILGLLSFKPAKPIWPVLEVRNTQGYEAAMMSWKILEKTIPEFGPEKIALLASLDRWDQMESEGQAGVIGWDGKDGNAAIVNNVNLATGRLWDAGLHERSIALSKVLISKADDTAVGQVANVSFNAGYRMILMGQVEEGQALIQRFIAQVEKEPEAIEWQSGNAFLDALRVCALTGDGADRALARLNNTPGDLYSQRAVAYECQKDETRLANLIADQLRNGTMGNRLSLAIGFAPTLENSSHSVSPTTRAAIQIEPLKSTISELFRPYPDQQ